jgi:hypothetical protein
MSEMEKILLERIAVALEEQNEIFRKREASLELLVEKFSGFADLVLRFMPTGSGVPGQGGIS